MKIWRANDTTGRVCNKYHIRPVMVHGVKRYQVVDTQRLTQKGKYKVVRNATALSLAMAWAHQLNASNTGWGEGSRPLE